MLKLFLCGWGSAADPLGEIAGYPITLNWILGSLCDRGGRWGRRGWSERRMGMDGRRKEGKGRPAGWERCDPGPFSNS